MYSVIQENPYQLADDIQGVGFKIADEIAAKVGIFTDSDYRIRSGIFYTLLQGVNAGHIFLDEELLARRAGQLLEVDLEHIEKYFDGSVYGAQGDPERSRRREASISYQLLLYGNNTAKMLHDLNVT